MRRASDSPRKGRSASATSAGSRQPTRACRSDLPERRTARADALCVAVLRDRMGLHAVIDLGLADKVAEEGRCLRGEHVIPFVSTSPEMASVDRPAPDQLMDHLHARCLASDMLSKAVERNAEFFGLPPQFHYREHLAAWPRPSMPSKKLRSGACSQRWRTNNFGGAAGLGRMLRDQFLAPSLRWNGNVWIRADCRAFCCTPVRTTLNAAMPDSVDALLTRSAARRTDRPALIVDVHRWGSLFQSRYEPGAP